MPYLCQKVNINNFEYLDGGITDPIPIKRAINKGYKKNIVILTRNNMYKKKDSILLDFLSKKMYKDYPELIIALNKRIELYNKIINYLENLEKNKQILVIRPQKVLVGRMTNNKNKLNMFYKQGFEIAEKRINEIINFIND
ncbi:DUF6363 domain-containing protein [Anaeromassilibacillus sp. An172]|uniref:DUF6363 domain-containing protein n=1 Tax=Anaeromassilibacillus sp. An172 TaxID=1965570 RepID=UPI001302CD9F|nr:DUF6363 domain-containing protein [Anaeromassilibacillus sp. An172]